MSVVAEIEGVAEDAIPQLRSAKIAGVCLLAVVVIAIVAALIWLIFIRPHQAQVAKATAKVEAVTAQASSGASQAAVQIVTVHDKEVDHINTVTEGGVRAVQSAADAGTPVPAVAAALRTNLCMFDAYGGDAGCPALPGTCQGVGAAGSNAGSAAAGR